LVINEELLDPLLHGVDQTVEVIDLKDVVRHGDVQKSICYSQIANSERFDADLTEGLMVI
jgi:hypothetical protein